MNKKILLFNHKGGVSKTTTALNIGWHWNRPSFGRYSNRCTESVFTQCISTMR